MSDKFMEVLTGVLVVAIGGLTLAVIINCLLNAAKAM